MRISSRAYAEDVNDRGAGGLPAESAMTGSTAQMTANMQLLMYDKDPEGERARTDGGRRSGTRTLVGRGVGEVGSRVVKDLTSRISAVHANVDEVKHGLLRNIGRAWKASRDPMAVCGISSTGSGGYR